MATNQVAHLGIKVSTTGASKAKSAIKGVGDTAKRVKDQIFSLNGAMGALGAGAVMKSVIQSAAGLESLKVRLKFLTGSVHDAGKAFDTKTGFASKVPFALEDIQKASPLLLTITDDIDELNGLLEMTGDIAAVSGLDFVKTAEQLQRAMASGIASADLFRERGVASFLGFEQGVTYSADETKKKLNEMWTNNTTTAVGATKELAKTFQGQVSMMEDAWFKLKIQFADTGVFEMAKDLVVDITEALGKRENIEAIQQFGKSIVSIGKDVRGVVAQFLELPDWVKSGGLLLAIFGGMKGKAALALLVGFADEVKKINEGVGKAIGLITRDVDEVLDDINRVENAIGMLKASIRASEKVPLVGTLLATSDKADMVVLEKQLANLKAELTNILNKQPVPLLLQPTVSTVANKPDGWKLPEPPKPEVFNVFDFTKGGTADKRLKGFVNTIQKYKDSILKVTKVMTPLQKLEKERDEIIEKINEGWKAGILLDVEKESGIRAVSDAYKEAAKSIEDLAIDKKVAEMSKNMQDSITESIMNMGKGLGSFRDVVNSIFDDIAAKVIQANISAPIADAISGAIGGQAKGGGFFGNIFKNMFKAEGGTVTGNQPYIVGEQGAELFVPNKTGTIVPNGVGGGSVTNINVNYSPQVNALDPRTAQIVIAENAPTVVGIVRQAFNRNGRAVAL